MTREAWLKAQIALIKAGATIPQRCTMAVAGRVELGFCLGDVPADRAHRCLDTCSPECAADKKRLRRWEASKGKCRACGHGLSKKERDRLKQEALCVLNPLVAVQIPDSGTEEKHDG